jgi:hypothetical protein
LGGIVAQRPWWIGGSEAKKGPGSDSPFRYFFNGVFELPPLTEKKRDSKKMEEKTVLEFLSIFLYLTP